MNLDNDEPTLSDLDDAIIEDSITCRRCKTRSSITDGFSFPSNSDRWVCEECTQEEIDSLARERDEARDWVRRMTAETQILRCAFCGESYPPGTPDSNHEALTAHVKVCAKHPMREMEHALELARIYLETSEFDKLHGKGPHRDKVIAAIYSVLEIHKKSEPIPSLQDLADHWG